MKKFFTVLTALLLFFTFVNAQNYPKCNVCSGKKTVFKTSGVRQECNNCKNWADSYKRKVPCDFCNDNRYVIGPGYAYCTKCNGTGKGTEQRKKEYAEAINFFDEKEAAYKRSFEYRASQLGKLPDGTVGSGVDLEKLLGEDYFKDGDAKLTEIKMKKDEKKHKKNVAPDNELRDLINQNNPVDKKDERLEGLDDELPSGLNKKDYNSEKVQEKNIPDNLKQKSKIKKDNYYFTVSANDINTKSNSHSVSIIDNSGGVNLFDEILTERDKEVLKIENWKSITFAKILLNNRGDVIGVKLNNNNAPLGDKTRNYQLTDGEAFELAKMFVNQAKDRIKYN
jgi:hypothetical protein